MSYLSNVGFIFHIDKLNFKFYLFSFYFLLSPLHLFPGALDFETHPFYQITIEANDGHFTATIEVDISINDINEGGPTFTSTIYNQTSLSEASTVGTNVVTVTATDIDSATSPFGKLTYSITNGNDGNKFIMESNTGKITVAGVLNADVKSSYLLTVQAIEDSGVNSATATVNITLADVNDNSPECSTDMAFSNTFAEDTTLPLVLFSFTCSDADGDVLTYTLQGNAAFFSITGTNVEVSTKQGISCQFKNLAQVC